jgi:hypothetical protein
VSNLDSQLAVARAVYAASPTAVNKAVAVDLVRQLAAEKRAAAPVVDINEMAKAAKAAQEARAQARAKDAGLDRAKRLYEVAHEYPRCGQNWPFGKKEEDAMALLIKTAKEQL